MTLKVICPNCGPRHHDEFWFGGELVSHGTQPEHSTQPSNPLDADYERVWLHTNRAGVQRERWFHHAGCRRWLIAERNTLTNEFDGPA